MRALARNRRKAGALPPRRAAGLAVSVPGMQRPQAPAAERAAQAGAAGLLLGLLIEQWLPWTAYHVRPREARRRRGALRRVAAFHRPLARSCAASRAATRAAARAAAAARGAARADGGRTCARPRANAATADAEAPPSCV